MTWEQRLQQLIAPGVNKFPYRVVQVKPNRKVDEEIYTLSGREEDIAANGSLFLALYDMAQRDRPDFEKWFQQWELGFPQFNSDRATSNFALAGDSQWKRIKEPESRPRYRELTNSQQRADLGYRVIEYWKDRSDEKNSIILGGVTDLMLIDRILAYEYQGESAKGQQQQPISSDTIRYSGIPEITLYFKGFDRSEPTREREITGEKSFRFMGYTDNPEMALKRQDLQLISQADITRIGAKIKSVFGTSPAYQWSKGKKQVAYHDWLRGYNLNVFCSTHAEGERMVGNILALRDLTIDETFLKLGEAKNPAKAYPPAKDIQVLGKTLKTPERLPTVDVTFQYATIYLATLKRTEYIA